MMKKITTLILLFLYSSLCFTQTLTLSIPENHFKTDESMNMILAHLIGVEAGEDLSGYNEITLNFGQTTFTFESTPDSLVYSQSYSVHNAQEQFILYFTPLPIISIETEQQIANEPKRFGAFTYSDEEQVLVSGIGIELRGGSSLGYPKNNYDLEFWEDETGEVTHDVQFGNLRVDDDWILNSLYNEPLRMRSFIANKLWLDMHKPYYQEEEPDANSGADMMYVELFLQGAYNGIYLFSEQADKKQLQLKSFNGAMRGELYKGIHIGASDFTALPNFNNLVRYWSGYSMKYPKKEEMTDWQNVYDFTDFVMNSSDSAFVENIWEYFNYENLRDYFIFLNFLRATDNTGKNIYLAKYKSGEPYFYVPWDLDGCLGTIYNGSQQNISQGILLNGLLDRVMKLDPNHCFVDFSNRWYEYREHILDEKRLEEILRQQFQFFTNNRIYEREALVFPNYDFDFDDMSYMLKWVQRRIEYLDGYFEIPVNEEIDHSESSAVLFPNPAKGKVYWKDYGNLKSKEYKIYNFSGRLMAAGIIENDFINIDHLETGSYLIVVENMVSKLFVK